MLSNSWDRQTSDIEGQAPDLAAASPEPDSWFRGHTLDSLGSSRGSQLHQAITSASIRLELRSQAARFGDTRSHELCCRTVQPLQYLLALQSLAEADCFE